MDALPQPPEPGSVTASPGGRWARAGVLSAGLWFLATLTSAWSGGTAQGALNITADNDAKIVRPLTGGVGTITTSPTVTLWNAQPGNQKIGALVVLVAGPLAFLAMGRVHRLRSPGDWSRAAILTIGLYAVACVIALVLLVIVSCHPA